MYYFEARFIDMDNEKEIVRKIMFDDQFLSCEKECYLYAMGKAYDMVKKDEFLLSVEFIGC